MADATGTQASRLQSSRSERRTLVLSNHDRVTPSEASAWQAEMPALQSVGDVRTIRDSAYIYRVRDYPRDFVERWSKIVAIDLDAIDAWLERLFAVYRRDNVHRNFFAVPINLYMRSGCNIKAIFGSVDFRGNI